MPSVFDQFMAFTYISSSSFRFSTRTEERLLKSSFARNALKYLIIKENFFPISGKAKTGIASILRMKSLFIWEEPMGVWSLLLSLT